MRCYNLSVLGAVVGLVKANEVADQIYKHVAAFSIDGFHNSDVDKYIAKRPGSTIAQLLKTGYVYTDALTSGPSDSFPGTLNQYTGASPRTTGVWYDDTYDRSFYAPGSDCSGPPGAEVVYDESKDYNSSKLFSGGIDPANLPRAVIGGKCTGIYPHARLRVNTIFELVNAAGGATAYTDKHPAYDLVRGPSGKGLSTGYFPEIASVPTEIGSTIQYDTLHVNAFLEWLDGAVPKHSEGSLDGKIPTLFGGNFQSVSVAQKTVGYEIGNLDFSPELLGAIDFVDQSLGKVVTKLQAKGIYNDTLIIIASKHGQAPIDPALYRRIAPKLVTNATGVDVLFQTSDDIANIFLKNHADVNTAVDNLNRNRKTLQIEDIISRERLAYLGYGDPLKDPAVPDIIVRPELGVIYTTSTTKIAEHGGLSNDDRKVACFVSNPKLQKKVYPHQISTKQIAPTILKVLGLDPSKLRGAVAENTNLLTGF